MEKKKLNIVTFIIANVKNLKINMITQKPNIDSWYTPKKLLIEYDGRACNSRCGNDIDCPHEEIHAKYLKEIFDITTLEERNRIVKWLSDNDFEDTVRELYDEHCSDCWGTQEAGEDEDGNKRYCHCAYEAEQAADANSAWADRNL